jgi:hypothetical protein
VLSDHPNQFNNKPEHSGNIHGQEIFTEIPISLFAKIVESIDDGEAFAGMDDNSFQTTIARNRA